MKNLLRLILLLSLINNSAYCAQAGRGAPGGPPGGPGLRERPALPANPGERLLSELFTLTEKINVRPKDRQVQSYLDNLSARLSSLGVVVGLLISSLSSRSIDEKTAKEKLDNINLIKYQINEWLK